MVIKLSSKLEIPLTRTIYEHTRPLQNGELVSCQVEFPDEWYQHRELKPGRAEVIDEDTLRINSDDGEIVSTFSKGDINKAQDDWSLFGFVPSPELPIFQKSRLGCNRLKRLISMRFLGEDIETSARIIWEPTSSSKERT